LNVSETKVEVGPPLVGFSDHDENFTMFDIKVEEANLGNHFVATIETGGKVFEARHASRSQAIADVEAYVRDAHKRGEVFPGIF
jgi:hypothetical protein